MSNGNYVPFSREMPPDTTWYTNKNKTLGFVMFALILDAKYKNGAWNGVSVNRGDVVFGRGKYATKLGMNEKTLAYSLVQLEKLGEIKVETKPGWNGYTKVSILKYNDYVAHIKNKPKNKEENEGDNYDHYFDDAVQF